MVASMATSVATALVDVAVYSYRHRWEIYSTAILILAGLLGLWVIVRWLGNRWAEKSLAPMRDGPATARLGIPTPPFLIDEPDRAIDPAPPMAAAPGQAAAYGPPLADPERPEALS